MLYNVYLPLDLLADVAEGLLDKLADAVHLTCGNHKVLGLVQLQHLPHRLDIVLGVTPIPKNPWLENSQNGVDKWHVPEGVQVAQLEELDDAERDLGNRPRDLARHKGFSSPGTLVVEQDTVDGEHVVGLPEVDHAPEREELCHSVWGSGVEGGLFCLGHFLNFSVQLGRGSLFDSLWKKLVKLRWFCIPGRISQIFRGRRS